MFQKRSKHDHPRMNVAPDQTIVLCQQIILDHRSLSSIDQKILMTPAHNGRTVAPEAILFESPCRAHPET